MPKSNTALSRFSTQESATKAPGCCLTCKSSKGPFVDPRLQIFTHGAVYLCVNCVREMASNLGLFDESEAVVAEREEIAEVDQLVDKYVAAVNGLFDFATAAHAAVHDVFGKNAQSGALGDFEPVSELPELTSVEGSAGVSSDPSSAEPAAGNDKSDK